MCEGIIQISFFTGCFVGKCKVSQEFTQVRVEVNPKFVLNFCNAINAKNSCVLSGGGANLRARKM